MFFYLHIRQVDVVREEDELDEASQPVTAGMQPQQFVLGVGNNPFLSVSLLTYL